jgi:membrane fusion protein, macrolide-specific efflux system
VTTYRKPGGQPVRGANAAGGRDDEMSNDRRVSLRRILSRPFIVAGVVLVVAGGSVGAWAVTRSTPSANPSHRLFPAVRTTLRQTLSANGTIEPTTTDTLSFAASGQVTAVSATVGQRVTAGQNLATMESASLQAQVAQAKATLAEDQSRLSQDEASGASSEQIAADQATVNADQSQVESADTALTGATLTAPIDGIVATVGLTAGEQVSGGSGAGGGGADGGSGGTDGGSGGGGDSGSGDSGSGSGEGAGEAGGGSGSSDTSITVISASDVVNANVSASVVDHIKAGDPVVITTEGANGPVTGTVASIGLTADTSSGVPTFPVVIDVTGTPSGLYAGASASVTITYHQVADALAVPSAAILLGPGGKTVVHAIVNGRQVTKMVTTGLTVNGLTQITSGLTAGQRVVVNLVRISPGNSGPGGGSGIFVGPGGHVIQISGGPGPGIGG